MQGCKINSTHCYQQRERFEILGCILFLSLKPLVENTIET